MKTCDYLGSLLDSDCTGHDELGLLVASIAHLGVPGIKVFLKTLPHPSLFQRQGPLHINYACSKHPMIALDTFIFLAFSDHLILVTFMTGLISDYPLKLLPYHS